MSKLAGKAKIYYSIRSRLGLVKNDWKERWPLSFPKRLKMWKLGFLSDKYVAYSLDQNNPELYSSDFQEVMARFINQPYSEVLNNKLIFEQVYSQYVRVPKTYALIDAGYYLEYPASAEAKRISRPDIYRAVEELAGKHGLVVIKPVRGAMGFGVMIVEATGNGQLKVNGKIGSREDLARHFNGLRENFVSQYIEQAGYSKQIYPGANNTMRVVTMVCPDSNEPFIAAAVKRIGTDRSAPVDNNSIGGMAAAINLDSGVLTAASRFMGDHVAWFERHPDSGHQIKGIAVPNWAVIKAKLLAVAGALPFIKYVGWDVVDQDEGIVIIEGNNHPQSRLLQMHKPLFQDSRVANFYRYYGLLKT